MRATTLALVALLTGCGGSTVGADAGAISKIATDTYALVVRPGASADQLLDASKKKCEGHAHCQVLAWDDASKAASAMPMLDREAQAVVFSYSLNRATGFERALWNCARFKRSSADECLAVSGPKE
jgi:hypothetical protein